MALISTTGWSTAGLMGRSNTGKLPSLYSPGLENRSGWPFGAQRKRHLVRVVY